MSPPSRAGARPHARRARIWLILSAVLFAGLVSTWILLRPSPDPYTPGTEAAKGEEITSSLSRALPEAAPRIRFEDVAAEAGIDFRHFRGTRSTQLPEDMGSGVAWGDYDGDGDPDLYLVNESGSLKADPRLASTPPARSALYRNDGDGTFTDVTGTARVGVGGLGMGAAWGDYDGDRDLDLVVTRYGTNVLFRNEGDGTFTDVSEATGLGEPEGFWTGASWADYERDGDLDLYVTGYVRYTNGGEAAGKVSYQYGTVLPYTLNPSSYAPERNLLFRNDQGAFREVAAEAGVANPEGRSLSASWCDFDQDGWPDLYVANDISDNAMYWNRGDGTFADVSHQAWVADYRGAMGLAVGDWDNDGDPDIFITHWLAQENALYENLHDRMPPTEAEPMHFIDQADLYGLGQIALDFVGWGTAFIDYDNDGRLDLFVVNGSTLPMEEDPSRLGPMRNLLFWNGGAREGYFETGAAAGEALAIENVGRGAAFADYDGDGDLDVAVGVNNGPARLLRNDGGNQRRWVRLVLRGPGDPSASHPTTSFAIGARVVMSAGGLTQTREVGCGSSYLSQDPPGELHFGVGDAERVDSLVITWPDGVKETFNDLPTGSTIEIVEGQQPAITGSPTGAGAPDKAAVVRFWRRFREATRLRLDGDLRGAVGAYQEALSFDPRHEESLYYLGQCLRQLARWDEARGVFTRLLAINPRSARGNAALGSLLASNVPGAPLDLPAAEGHFRRAHEINGEETGPMVRLGEILILRGDTREAAEWLEAAAATNPKSVEAAFLSGYLHWSAGDLDAAGEAYLRAVRALQGEAPVKGVLGEGDRASGDAGRVNGDETIFGRFCSSLAGDEKKPEAGELVMIYGPVREFTLDFARKGSPAGSGR